MGAEKHGSKGGAGYVGGLLQLFDWNAKSRKKLFSRSSSAPELSKQQKRCDGSMPVTLLHLVAEDDILTGSSVKGSSDYSCASSMTDEDLCVPRAPGVVARLMGLDSLTTTSNVRETYSSSHFDTRSLQDLPFHSQYQGSHPFVQSRKLQDKMDAPIRNALEQKHTKTLKRPIEKFQAEILPPKSTKSIPITHHKLLSPIKSANFIPAENAAHIMEVAARIIGPRPEVTAKPKLPVVGSSSVPLKVKDLKQKVRAAEKQSKLAEASASCLPHETIAFKHPNGASRDQNRNGPTDAILVRESSNYEAREPITKGRNKSLSLALQAKANVQKREGLSSSCSRSQVDQKELDEGLKCESFKQQPSIQKYAPRKSSSPGSSRILQQNNQKQNCLADRVSMPSKQSLPSSQGRKPVNGYSSVARYKCSSRNDDNSRVVSRRSRSEVTDGNSEDSYSSTRSISRKKRSIDGNIHVEKTGDADKTRINRAEKLSQFSVSTEKERSFAEAGKKNGTDVVSFTFTTPMTRSIRGNETLREVQQKRMGSGADLQVKGSLPCKDDVNCSKFSALKCNIIGSDALSSLLDQALRELSCGLDASLNKQGKGNTSPSSFEALMPNVDALPTVISSLDRKTQESWQTHQSGTYPSSAFSSTDFQRIKMKQKIQGLDLEINKYRRSNIEVKEVLEHRHPSPVSVLENSFLSESCNSSDTAHSSSAGAGKQSSSVQALEVLGASPFEADAELSDSASSISARTFTAKQEFTSSSSDLWVSTQWELEYVKEILSDIDVMFMDFTVGRTQKIIDPHIFNQNWFVEKNLSSSRHKLLSDCIAECIGNRCRRHASGGCKAWIDGLYMVKRKERLAEDIYKEISGWSSMGGCMVDELVEKDMSNKYGRWLDFEIEVSELGMQIENRILNVLLDEVIADIL